MIPTKAGEAFVKLERARNAALSEVSMTKNLLKVSGMLIALFNIVNVLNSSWFFLGKAKFPIDAWLAFNACAPSVVLYLAGYFSKKNYLMAASLPFLLFFGTCGLFVFGWSGTAVYAQIGHIAMTMASAWIIIKIIAEKNLKPAAAGLICAVAVFALVLPLQQRYVKSHPEYLKKLGDSTFEDYINSRK